jgi:hypothetical protein
MTSVSFETCSKVKHVEIFWYFSDISRDYLNLLLLKQQFPSNLQRWFDASGTSVFCGFLVEGHVSGFIKIYPLLQRNSTSGIGGNCCPIEIVP